MYEDSIRVPFIVRDPRLPETLRGQRSTEMALNIDVAPTILSMAGVSLPSSVQGMDLQPLMCDPSAKGRDDWYYEHVFNQLWEGVGIPENEGVRTRQWKYMRLTEDSPPYELLFDLTHDPDEEHNLARHPACGAQLDHLRARCDEYRRALA